MSERAAHSAFVKGAGSRHVSRRSPSSKTGGQLPHEPIVGFWAGSPIPTSDAIVFTGTSGRIVGIPYKGRLSSRAYSV
jgi:hypothetical protein